MRLRLKSDRTPIKRRINLDSFTLSRYRFLPFSTPPANHELDISSRCGHVPPDVSPRPARSSAYSGGGSRDILLAAASPPALGRPSKTGHR